jgi:hypothetical protein
VTGTQPDLVPDNNRADEATRVEPLTVIQLSAFSAEAGDDSVRVWWETMAEIDTEGFNLWRSQVADGSYVKLNTGLIPARGNADTGASYEFTDGDVVNGVTYYYKLEDVDLHGISTFHGPVSVTLASTHYGLEVAFCVSQTGYARREITCPRTRSPLQGGILAEVGLSRRLGAESAQLTPEKEEAK